MRWLAIAFIVLVAACGGADAVADSTTTTSTALATTTTARAPTTTAVPEQPLVLVTMGDSFVAWSSWPQMYGDLVAESLSREIVVDTTLARAGQGPRLPAIKDDPDAHALIRSADIIVVQPEPGFIARFATQYLAGECGESKECFGEAAAEYRIFLEEYVDLVVEHADPGSAIRLVTTGTWGIDAFYDSVRDNDPEAHADLVGVVTLIMDELKAVGAERGIPVADVNAAFNGDDYLQLAPEEYLVADGIHLADAGSEVVAALLNDLGYDDLGR